jgi:hypothetical protein
MAFSYWIDKPWFLTEGKTCFYIHHTFLLGFPNWPVIYFITTMSSIAIKTFSGAVAREEKEDFCKGSFARTSFNLF